MADRERLEQAIAALEAQRSVLGDAAVELALAALRQRLAELRAAPAPSLEGERRLVTVMFADISGFTALADTMGPEAVRDLMNACFEILVPIVEKYGGAVDKFIGDEIVALFGAPLAHENDPERALRAALEMMDALDRFNAERTTALGVHFGINSGLVIAGGIGVRGRQEYSVMGDAVNLAARLEEVSERGEILVGPGTHRLTEPLFEFEPLATVQVKGKAEPVPVYRLLAAKAVRGKGRGIAGLESSLVGRQAEFRALREAVVRLQGGEGGIVTLVGEAGLGKSRLVAELREQTLAKVRQPSQGWVQWVEGRCLSYGVSIAYLLWLDVLRGLLGVTLKDPPLAVRDVLREQVQSLCPERFDDVYPYLGRLMSLSLEAEYEATMRDLEGESLKSGVFRAVETFIGSAAREQPLVVICEDLHWADPTSLELLEQLLALTERVPLLLLCVLRPEREHGCWRVGETAARLYRHRYTGLWLKPLSAAESETLVGNLLRVEDLPQRLRERILDHAEGNPFYVEEIIRSLMDSEAIARDEATGRWRAARDVTDIAIPDTLHGVLMARIDRLQEETKRVLQMAAVIGRIFPYRVLAAIAQEERAGPELNRRELDGHLLTLQREGMIRERTRALELQYIFKHHLTQEAAYNGLLKKKRRIFHRQVAEALERLFPDRIEEQVGLLAHHWERAEEPEKATEYLLRAGDQARAAYAHQEAIDYYRRALAFLKEQGEHGRAARTLMKLGLTYHTAFDFQRSRQAYEEGFALWQRAGETREGTPPPPAPHALRVAWYDLPTLDWIMAGESVSANVLSQLFSGLVELSPELDVVPSVAQTWEVSEGGRKYVFHLRKGARWSDGVPLTAGDFEYAWKRVLDPATGSPIANVLYDIKGARAFHQGEVSDPDQVGVQAFDERTLVVELERPTGYFLQLLVIIGPVPQHAIEARGEAWAEVGKIVTNGPFRLEAWQRAESMILLRNPEYHGRFTGNVQRVELCLLPDPAAKLARYEAGELDILDLQQLPPLERDRARQRHAGEYISAPRLVTLHAEFNVRQPPFDDPRVRRAFALTTDQETLAEVVMRGYVAPATGGFVPPEMPGHSPGIGLPYDPEQARRLLAEAGYPDGRGFPAVDLMGSHGFHFIRKHLQSQWQERLGVRVSWELLEQATSSDRLNRRPPHIFLWGWTAGYPDPDNFLRVSTAWRLTHWQNETYDGFVESARCVVDVEERMRMYRRADRLLIEAAVIVPLAYGRRHILVKPWVKRFPTSAIRTWFWKDVIIEPH